MTITRLWQAVAEYQDVLTEFTSRSSTNFVTSNTVAKTGSYSFRTSANRYATIVLPSSYTQARAGMHVYHQGGTAGDDPSICQFLDGSTVVVDLRWDTDTNSLKLYIGTTQQATVVSSVFANEDTWHHIGIDAKIHASTGWVEVYLNGVSVLSYSGDTTGGSTALTSLLVGSPRSADLWETYIYYDDLFVDNLAGESAADIVPDYRFEFLSPNANPTNGASQWDGSDGDGTDNYLLVDEAPPDGDTTYVETDVSGENDDYDMSNFTLPTGFEVNAVIPQAVAKKQNAGGGLGIKLRTRTVVAATPYLASSALFTLGTDYLLYFERRALRPDGGAWDETTVNALEIGVQATS